MKNKIWLKARKNKERWKIPDRFFYSKFGAMQINILQTRTQFWKNYVFGCNIFTHPWAKYLTIVQQGDRNHWRNGEWKADAKISCYRCNTSRKECLFSVKRSNNENFLTWIYGTFCVCVWEHITQYWFLIILTPIPYQCWNLREN